MKKILLTVMSLAFAFGASAQTIVDTTVHNRNVVIEEFTGIGCGYCPLGHQNVAEYSEAHSGRVVPINIHQGGYTQGYSPNYTTQYGDALANQTNLGGYPSGTLNRTPISSCKISTIGPSGTTWESTANGILNQVSPVNIGATASVDAATRTMTINVEVYYRQEVSQSFNLLNVVLLQDNIKGEQHNYGNYNPSQITADGKYIHMHMLRDMITGQWGDSLTTHSTTIPAGTLITKTYTYTIPATLSNVEVKLGDINLAVFVTDGYATGCTNIHGPNIYTGIRVNPTYNLTAPSASISSITLKPKYGCNDLVVPSVKFRNEGENITSVDFTYKDGNNNTTQTYTFTGSLLSFSDTTIDLPAIPVTIGSADNIIVSIDKINGTTMSNISNVNSITKASPVAGNGIPRLVLKRDRKGSEITWKLYNFRNDVVANGGPYVDTNTAPSTPDTILLPGVEVAGVGCYTFEINDAGSDGINGSYGRGFYKIYDADNTLLLSSDGKYGAQSMGDFKITSGVGLTDANDNVYQTLVYPNPANDKVNIQVSVNSSTQATIEVVDMLGRQVISLGDKNLVSGDNNFSINTSNLNNGMFFVRIVTNSGIVTKKLSINK
jgi:hypothetical protein